MPDDSNGNYSLPVGYLAVTGQKVLPSNHNPPLEDVAAALSARFSRDGRAPLTGNMNANSNKIYALANGVDPGDAVNKSQLDAVSAETAILGSNSADCRLSLSGGNLLLSRYGGRRLSISGVGQLIPSAGVTLAATGLTPSATYYIYAYMNAGTMTLEASATAHATDSSTGVEIKSGDATRTLVGMARVVTGPAFADSASQRLVLSWFNRRDIGGQDAFGTDRSTSSTSYVEVDSEIRVEFLTWAGEAVSASTSATVANSTAGRGTVTAIAFDGTTPEAVEIFSISASANYDAGATMHLEKNGLSEGYHYATLIGKTDGTGTSRWRGASAVFGKTVVSVGIRG